MEDLAGEPVTVNDVEIVGLSRTRSRVVASELRGVRSATTFGGLLASVAASVAALEDLELFESVSAAVDRSGGPSPVAGPDAVSGMGVGVRVVLKEKQPYALKVGATTAAGDGGEVKWEAAGTLRSPLGYGELLSATLSQGAASGSECRLGARRRAVLPAVGPVVFDASLERGAGEAAYAPAAAGTRALTTTTTAAAFGAAARDGSRYARIEAADRGGVQDAAHGSEKWSLVFGWRSDGRDSRIAPASGAGGDARVEVAGAGGLGDAAFVKGEASAQAHRALGAVANGNIVASLTAKLGAQSLLPAFLRGGAPPPIPADDRFYLGGPLGLRCFDRAGVGPRAPPTADPAASGRAARAGASRAPSLLLASWRDMRVASGGAEPPRRGAPDGDAALPFAGPARGGSLVASAAALLSCPLPGKTGASGLSAHAFATAGALVDADLRSARPADLARGVVDEARCAAGVGLVFAPANFARLELNYGWVLRAQACDLVKRLQFAVSGDFGS